MSDDDETTYSAIKTVLGGTRRDQRWHLTDEVDVLTFLGSSRFDLRTVETSGSDVVEINITCVLGVVDLLVPAGTMVVLDGTSFLASARSAVAAGDDLSLPRLEVTATTILGRVRVRSPRPEEALEVGGEIVDQVDQVDHVDHVDHVGQVDDVIAEVGLEPEGADAEFPVAVAEPVEAAAVSDQDDAEAIDAVTEPVADIAS